ncbi:PQ-loop-domain-containing protein [Thozetella sp. PMI_491]|nr:PQ-loop-domain-containing protein [Thozetella sp. PMI_491]
MAPPTGPLNLDVEAISGICGSISIACWVVVFSPQIVENFRRSSAEGLSIQFIIVWLLGDVFNILGAVLQGVLPTMIILAIYYTIADVVLLCQCFYYRGFTWKDDISPPARKPSKPHRRVPDEQTRLLPNGPDLANYERHERRGSDWSNLEHLSPAMPLVTDAAPPATPRSFTVLQNVAFNTVAVLMVCTAGVAGWWLSRGYAHDDAPQQPGDHGQNEQKEVLTINVLGQVFGWLCAVLYLGSRLPQLLLNYRRKSTEGVSMLFFLFACLGNLTYVLSIFAFEPRCQEAQCQPGEAAAIYGQYMLVNLSWLAGSAGTLLLDLGIFVQFFLYNKADPDSDEEEGSDHDGESDEDDEWDQRPVLERGTSDIGP